jgi:hypothetical protein
MWQRQSINSQFIGKVFLVRFDESPLVPFLTMGNSPSQHIVDIDTCFGFLAASAEFYHTA